MIRNRALPAFAVLIVVFASGCASIGGGDHLAEIRILPHQSVQHGADAVSVQTAIGRQHLREGDNAGAISAFERALAAAPHDVDALNARAVAFLRIGRFDAAVADLQAAIAVTPDQAYLHSNLGYVLMRQGQYRLAADAMHRGFALDPRHPRLRSNWRELIALVGTKPDAPASPAPALASAGEPAAAAFSATTSASVSVSVSATAPAAAAEPAPAATFGSAPVTVTTAQATGYRAVHNIGFAPPALADAAPAANSTPTVHVSTTGPGSGDARNLSAHTLRPRADVRPPVRILRVGRHENLEPVAAPTALAGLARIEVSNGNGVRGFARRTSKSLRQLGGRITMITNAAHFGFGATTVYYRPGHEDEARRIAAALPGPTPALEALEAAVGIDIRVVLGADAIKAPDTTTRRHIVG